MKITCPDCGREFFVSLQSVAMIAESFRRNPELRWICGRCGERVWQYYGNRGKSVAYGGEKQGAVHM